MADIRLVSLQPAAAAGPAMNTVTESGAAFSTGYDYRVAEDRELYRLATQIALHDPMLTEALLLIGMRKPMGSSSGLTAG